MLCLDLYIEQNSIINNENTNSYLYCRDWVYMSQANFRHLGFFVKKYAIIDQQITIDIELIGI